MPGSVFVTAHPSASTPGRPHPALLLTAMLMIASMAMAQSSSTPRPIAGLNGITAALAVGRSHVCALSTAGGVVCWGANQHGQLGDGSGTSASPTPLPVSGLGSGVAALAAGEAHTCALNTRGGVVCWGANSHGQLGNGSRNDSRTPQTVSGLASGVAAIAAGSHHTCAITMQGAVQCWGSNGAGQLGSNNPLDSAVPLAVSGLSSQVAAVAAGYRQSCAIQASGSAQCWGMRTP